MSGRRVATCATRSVLRTMNMGRCVAGPMNSVRGLGVCGITGRSRHNRLFRLVSYLTGCGNTSALGVDGKIKIGVLSTILGGNSLGYSSDKTPYISHSRLTRTVIGSVGGTMSLCLCHRFRVVRNGVGVTGLTGSVCRGSALGQKHLSFNSLPQTVLGRPPSSVRGLRFQFSRHLSR